MRIKIRTKKISRFLEKIDVLFIQQLYFKNKKLIIMIKFIV